MILIIVYTTVLLLKFNEGNSEGIPTKHASTFGIFEENETLGVENSRKQDSRYITLIHGNIKRRIRDKDTLPYPSFLDPEVTILSTDTLPEGRFMPTIGNGHLATVAHSDSVFLNALYNGYNTSSHRARIPSTCSISVQNASFAIEKSAYKLDMGRGMYIEEHNSSLSRIELKLYAHQVLNRLLVTVITVTNNGNASVQVNLSQNMGRESEDVDFYRAEEGLSFFYGYQKEAEFNVSDKVYCYGMASNAPDVITTGPMKTEKYLFLTSIDYDVGNGTQFFMAGGERFLNGTLEQTHTDAWAEMWKRGRIDLKGNRTLSQLTYSSLYYILSGIPQFEKGEAFIGLSPGDLAHGAKNQDHNGHVFWDQEIWMFPSILALYADKGKSLLQTRTRTHDAAKEYAKMRGYQGAMYPFETAYSGLSVCPHEAVALYEQHVTGDVAYAFKLYSMMTRDTDFLKHGGAADLIMDIADFWVSRVSFNNVTGMYEINDIVPPGESSSARNNSVYTNTIAKESLLLPDFVLPLIDRSPAQRYREIANKIFVPFNVSGNFHPEYDGYSLGTPLEQADVVLLGYPLMLNMSKIVRRQDLEIYELVTTNGPAMTWGMFAIGWLEVGDLDRAMDSFNKQLLNVIRPYNVWSEFVNQKGTLNFVTGMGGYLQSILFGFGGFRIFPDRLEFNPTMPESVEVFNVTGIDYLGSSVDFSFWESGMLINLTKQGGFIFNIFTSAGQGQTLIVGEPVWYSRIKASIVPLF